MTVRIAVVGFDEEYDHDDEFPQILAVGEDEEQAVEIFAVLYNAHILTAKREDGKLSNQAENGVFACTYIIGMMEFASLRDYFLDIHGVKLEMTE